jgi:hypothetical protein
VQQEMERPSYRFAGAGATNNEIVFALQVITHCCLLPISETGNIQAATDHNCRISELTGLMRFAERGREDLSQAHERRGRLGSGVKIAQSQVTALGLTIPRKHFRQGALCS